MHVVRQGEGLERESPLSRGPVRKLATTCWDADALTDFAVLGPREPKSGPSGREKPWIFIRCRSVDLWPGRPPCRTISATMMVPKEIKPQSTSLGRRAMLTLCLSTWIRRSGRTCDSGARKLRSDRGLEAPCSGQRFATFGKHKRMRVRARFGLKRGRRMASEAHEGDLVFTAGVHVEGAHHCRTR